MQRCVYGVLQESLIRFAFCCLLCASSGCTTQSGRPDTDQRSSSSGELVPLVVKIETEEYANGQIKYKYFLGRDGQSVMSEFYLPDGSLLARTRWFNSDGTPAQGWTYYLDENGKVTGILTGSAGLAHGPFIKFDPPASPSLVRLYEAGDVIETSFDGNDAEEKDSE